MGWEAQDSAGVPAEWAYGESACVSAKEGNILEKPTSWPEH
jgi:hypothetical protein